MKSRKLTAVVADTTTSIGAVFTKAAFDRWSTGFTTFRLQDLKPGAIFRVSNPEVRVSDCFRPPRTELLIKHFDLTGYDGDVQQRRHKFLEVGTTPTIRLQLDQYLRNRIPSRMARSTCTRTPGSSPIKSQVSMDDVRYYDSDVENADDTPVSQAPFATQAPYTSPEHATKHSLVVTKSLPKIRDAPGLGQLMANRYKPSKVSKSAVNEQLPLSADVNISVGGAHIAILPRSVQAPPMQKQQTHSEAVVNSLVPSRQSEMRLCRDCNSLPDAVDEKVAAQIQSVGQTADNAKIVLLNDQSSDKSNARRFGRWRKRLAKTSYLARYAQTISSSQDEILQAEDSWQPALIGRPLLPGTLPLKLLNRITATVDSRLLASNASDVEHVNSPQSQQQDSIQREASESDSEPELPSFPLISSKPSEADDRIHSDLENLNSEVGSIDWATSPPSGDRRCLPPDSSPVRDRSPRLDSFLAPDGVPDVHVEDQEIAIPTQTDHVRGLVVPSSTVKSIAGALANTVDTRNDGTDDVRKESSSEVLHVINEHTSEQCEVEHILTKIDHATEIGEAGEGNPASRGSGITGEVSHEKPLTKSSRHTHKTAVHQDAELPASTSKRTRHSLPGSKVYSVNHEERRSQDHRRGFTAGSDSENVQAGKSTGEARTGDQNNDEGCREVDMEQPHISSSEDLIPRPGHLSMNHIQVYRTPNVAKPPSSAPQSHQRLGARDGLVTSGGRFATQQQHGLSSPSLIPGTHLPLALGAKAGGSSIPTAEQVLPVTESFEMETSEDEPANILNKEIGVSRKSDHSDGMETSPDLLERSALQSVSRNAANTREVDMASAIPVQHYLSDETGSESSDTHVSRPKPAVKRKLKATACRELSGSRKRTKLSVAHSALGSSSEDDDFERAKMMARQIRREFFAAHTTPVEANPFLQAHSTVSSHSSPQSVSVPSNHRRATPQILNAKPIPTATPLTSVSAPGRKIVNLLSEPSSHITIESLRQIDQRYLAYRKSYPDYEGNPAQFLRVCRMIKKIRTKGQSLPRCVWDDFVFRHHHDYRKFLVEAIESDDLESPISYEEYYGQCAEQPTRLRNVLKPAFIDALPADSDNASSLRTQPAPTGFRLDNVGYLEGSVAASSSASNIRPVASPAVIANVIPPEQDSKTLQEQLHMKNQEEIGHSQSSSVHLWLQKASGAASPELGTPAPLVAQKEDVSNLDLMEDEEGSEFDLACELLSMTGATDLTMYDNRRDAPAQVTKDGIASPSIKGGHASSMHERGGNVSIYGRHAGPPGVQRIIDIFSWRRKDASNNV